MFEFIFIPMEEKVDLYGV